LAAAHAAYGVANDVKIVAAPGTQILIQLLPVCFPASNVGIVGPTYSEHADCWARTGANVRLFEQLPTSDEARALDVVVVVNPNNPDGRWWAPDALAVLADHLSAPARKTQGLLVVDEAFVDLHPEKSLARQPPPHKWVVLKSFGKFFGLAGVRLGFAVGDTMVISKLEDLLGPWAVPGPALAVGAEALNDDAWANAARARYAREAAALDHVLSAAGVDLTGGTELYRLCRVQDAARLQAHLAQHRIWTRTFDYEPTWMRFGLPVDDEARQRLRDALADFTA